MSTASERHAARRAIIEAERAERRRKEEEALRRKNQVKKSSSIPAKWHWKGGVRIAGTPVKGGFFYAGANMKEMIEPTIPEPSLLNPKLPVAESSEGMEPLGSYPIYQFISEQQRKGYIEFIASDRTEAADIGFVFLYLYGIERRLIIDARKPGEVSEEERESIVNELLRILNVFGSQSRSLTHYIAMLLLYDGTYFKMATYEDIDKIYGLSERFGEVAAKTWENTDNSDAMTYMLATRLKEAGHEVPLRNLINLGKNSLMRNNSSFLNGIDEKGLYSPEFEKLIFERASFVDFSRVQSRGGRSTREVSHPHYFPSSPMIRKSFPIVINKSVCESPESLGLPVKKMADMVSTAYRELEACKSVLDTTSIRDIDTVQFDALSACSPERCALETSLTKTKSTATYISMQTIDDDLRRRFGQPVQYTSKGQMSVVSQQLIAVTAASLGWQAVLPETIDGLATASWRVDKDSKIVMFKRGMAHNKKNGKRCIGMIFGKDQGAYEFTIPGSWLTPSCLGYVYAWFVAKCGDAFTRDDLFKFSTDYLPEITPGGIPNNQKSLFFSLMYATYSLNLSTHGIKQCLSAVPFSSVQDVVFSLVNDSFGRMIPPQVMSVLEDLYKKAGKDKDMVLYDYQSGSYSLHASDAGEFFINEERLADTIKDTSSVHDMLNRAIGTEEEEIMLGSDRIDEEAQLAENDYEEENSENSEAEGADVKELIIEFFGDDDEAATEEFLAYLVARGAASTSAEANNLISELNQREGEEIVEIDGADVYLNL